MSKFHMQQTKINPLLSNIKRQIWANVYNIGPHTSCLYHHVAEEFLFSHRRMPNADRIFLFLLAYCKVSFKVNESDFSWIKNSILYWVFFLLVCTSIYILFITSYRQCHSDWIKFLSLSNHTHAHTRRNTSTFWKLKPFDDSFQWIRIPFYALIMCIILDGLTILFNILRMVYVLNNVWFNIWLCRWHFKCSPFEFHCENHYTQ